VPSPGGAGYAQVTLQIVTASWGIGLVPALRTLISMWVCWESVCEAGKLADGTSTLNWPTGSLASWGVPPPHAARARLLESPAMIAQLTLHPLTAR
jgi:hypothetical protein